MNSFLSFMSFLPVISSFFFILCFSIMFCLSSSHFFGVWIGLELNIISFVVIIISNKIARSRESRIKYFLLQSLGRGLFLLGFILSYINRGMWIVFLRENFSSLFILSGLALKLGSAPFHFWVPSVINSLNWSNALILSRLQKVAPLMFILYLISSEVSYFLVFMSSIGVLIGGLGGLNQRQFRALIGYSSIGHIGWVIRVRIISIYFSLYYFLVYLFRILVVFLFFIKININRLKYLYLNFKSLDRIKFLFFISLFSLGGLPPLIGFFPKILALNFLILNNVVFLSILIILGSVISLSYYLRIFFIRRINNFLMRKQINIFFFMEVEFLSIFFFRVLFLFGFVLMEILL